MTVPLDTHDSGSASIPLVCTFLRTKTAFGGHEIDDEPANWQSGESTTAVFWCLRTMATAGPDDQFAHPSACRAGRSCFKYDE